MARLKGDVRQTSLSPKRIWRLSLGQFAMGGVTVFGAVGWLEQKTGHIPC